MLRATPQCLLPGPVLPQAQVKAVQLVKRRVLGECHCFILGPHPRHMEVPRLGVKLELQLLAYTIATATPDLSCICDTI